MVDNKTVFYKKLYNAGIIYVNDPLDQEGKFDVYGTLGDEFNNMDYLKLIGIIHSIPNSWRRQITSKNVMEEANTGSNTLFRASKSTGARERRSQKQNTDGRKIFEEYLKTVILRKRKEGT